MKILKTVQLFSLFVLPLSSVVYAGGPDGPYGSNIHPAADMKWLYDGTGAAIITGLDVFLGQEKNIFGPVFEAGEGTVPKDSKLLSDFVPHILGIPGPEAQLPSGNFFYSGAEPHNATREVAIITQERGKEVLALALLQENYSKSPAAKELTIIVPTGKEPNQAMKEAFQEWAQGEIKRNNDLIKDSNYSKSEDKPVVKILFIGTNR